MQVLFIICTMCQWALLIECSVFKKFSKLSHVLSIVKKKKNFSICLVSLQTRNNRGMVQTAKVDIKFR